MKNEIKSKTIKENTMPKFTDEIALSVSDYIKKHGEEDCFDACAEDINEARRIFTLEAKNAEINLTNIYSIEFLEFDSNNPYHAGAYFEVVYDADECIWGPEDEMDFPQGSAE